MKHLLAIGVIMVALCSTSFAAPVDLLKVRTQMVSPAVKITSSGSCSGQIVHSAREDISGNVKTLILTAKHCVLDTDTNDIISISIPVYFNGNELVGEYVHLGKVIAKDKSSDLALIRLLDPKTIYHSTAIIEQEFAQLLIGEECYAIGFPMGGSLTITSGMIGSIEPHIIDGELDVYLRSTAEIAAGSSGGALYRYVNGEYRLIGITMARMRGTSFIGLWIPLSDIVPFLARHMTIT